MRSALASCRGLPAGLVEVAGREHDGTAPSRHGQPRMISRGPLTAELASFTGHGTAAA
jgi:hypothetical protein